MRAFDLFKLTAYEKRIDDALMRGEYRPVSKEESARTAANLKRFKRNKILHMRISTAVLDGLKRKAKKRCNDCNR